MYKSNLKVDRNFLISPYQLANQMGIIIIYMHRKIEGVYQKYQLFEL